MSSLTALLTDPDAFFRDRRDAPSLRGPVAVVVVIALVNALAAALQFRVMSQLFAELGVGSFVAVIQAFTFVFTLIGPFFVWVLYAGVFHAISLVFNGEGSFTTTLALVGWGFVPSVFGSIASMLINVYRFNVRGVTFPSNVTQESIQQFTTDLQTGPLVALAGVIGIVFTLWSAVLWTYGVEHARRLSTRDAALTVALPVLVSLLLSVWSIVNALVF